MTPVQILINLTASRSWKISFFCVLQLLRKPHLGMNKRECTLQNSNNNKLKVVLGITLSGILIIALALIVGIVLYRKKFGRNKEGVATKGAGWKRNQNLSCTKVTKYYQY
jgi:hypothetical protein